MPRCAGGQKTIFVKKTHFSGRKWQFFENFIFIYTVYSGGGLVRAQGVGGEAGVGAGVLGAEPEYRYHQTSR